MFDPKVIKKEFGGLVGWRQNPDPQGTQLQSSLTDSSSGYYFNDEHPMLTMDNILSICQDDGSFEYSTFSDSQAYKTGAIVTDEDGTFIRIKDGAANIPTSNTEYWKEFDFVSSWIEQKTESFIMQAFNDWYYNKEKFGTAQGVLAYNVLFANAGDAGEVQDIILTNQGEDVGITIETYKSQTVKYTCHEIGIQLEENATVSIKVQEIGQTDFVLEQNIEYTGAGSQQWHDIKFVFTGSRKYKVFYTVQDALNSPISSMRGVDMPYTQFYKVKGYNDGEETSENYGIDLKISVACDYTDLIVDQKDLFSDLVSKRVAMKFLRELIYNPHARLNRHEENIDDTQLLYEIDGDSQAKKENPNTLGAGYANALRALSFDRSKIDSVCLPCRRRGVRYTTTG